MPQPIHVLKSRGSTTGKPAAQLNTDGGSMGPVVRRVDCRPPRRQADVRENHLEVFRSHDSRDVFFRVAAHHPLDRRHLPLGLLNAGTAGNAQMDGELASVDLRKEFLARAPEGQRGGKNRGNQEADGNPTMAQEVFERGHSRL